MKENPNENNLNEDNKTDQSNRVLNADAQNLMETGAQKKQTRVYFYMAIVAAALGAVAFGLAFTVLKIYSLIASILFETAALSFLDTQKKKNGFKACFYVKIAVYVLLGVFAAFFIGGLVYSAL